VRLPLPMVRLTEELTSSTVWTRLRSRGVLALPSALQLRLNEGEVRALAADLAADYEDACIDMTDVGVAITWVTGRLPRPREVARVCECLIAKGHRVTDQFEATGH
jgi:hypothetical protein